MKLEDEARIVSILESQHKINERTENRLNTLEKEAVALKKELNKLKNAFNVHGHSMDEQGNP
jgi:chaperonin cofactor prefoldin